MSQVFTVYDYWDGCLLGVAEYDGYPHIYERIFDQEQDDYTDWYFLTPIPDDLCKTVMTDWSKWCVWRKQFDAGAAQPPFQSELDLKAIVGRLPCSRYQKCKGAFRGDYCHVESMSVFWST